MPTEFGRQLMVESSSPSDILHGRYGCADNQLGDVVVRSSIDDRRIRVVLIVLASLALTDCGGGGGGGGGSNLPADCVAPTPSLSGATLPLVLNHGASATISNGSAFGAKSPAGPVIADGAQ